MTPRELPGAGSRHELALPERYRVRRHLATGGMASVWCAEDVVLGRTVAIKVLAERFAHDEVAMRRFKREARAAARVSTHAHVVTIFDVGDLPDDGSGGGPRPFIVMEYLAGGTVADALRVRAVRREEAIRWMREAAAALDHAHAQGIVHRDIKPGNFLLNSSRSLRVADFGIARLVSEDTISTAGELVGTAAYLSPEQALGREATGASDRYALAVAAFELMTGRRPFIAAHFAAQARQHIEAERPRASEIDRTLPAAADAVLRRGMAREPDERYATAGAFVGALEAALSGRRPVPVAGATAPPAWMPATRHREPDLDPDPLTATMAHPVVDFDAPVAQPAAAAAAARTLRRVPAIAALAAVCIAAATLAATSLRLTAAGTRHSGTASVHGLQEATRAPAVVSAHSQHTTTRTTAASRPAAATAAAAASAAVTASAHDPVALQLAGHQEMLDGNYAAAIATLRHAVSTAPAGSTTYAYGLYDLGRSLYLAGNAPAAVQVLEQRMQIPNQIPVVQEALDQALRATGQVPAALTTSPPAGGATPSASSPSGGAGAPPAATRHTAGLHHSTRAGGEAITPLRDAGAGAPRHRGGRADRRHGGGTVGAALAAAAPGTAAAS